MKVAFHSPLAWEESGIPKSQLVADQHKQALEAHWHSASLKTSVMKANQKKRLTFGDLIASVYTACSQRRARAIVRFAVNAHVVVFPGERRFVIS